HSGGSCADAVRRFHARPLASDNCTCYVDTAGATPRARPPDRASVRDPARGPFPKTARAHSGPLPAYAPGATDPACIEMSGIQHRNPLAQSVTRGQAVWESTKPSYVGNPPSMLMTTTRVRRSSRREL